MTSSNELAERLRVAAEIGLKQVPRTPDGREIITSYDYPPIPVRCFDWSAVVEDYDGADDSHCPVGHGATEQEAINDLLEQVEEALWNKVHP